MRCSSGAATERARESATIESTSATNAMRKITTSLVVVPAGYRTNWPFAKQISSSNVVVTAVSHVARSRPYRTTR
jgi:hypothetical protein